MQAVKAERPKRKDGEARSGCARCHGTGVIGHEDRGGPKPVVCGCTTVRPPEPMRKQMEKQNVNARVMGGIYAALAKSQEKNSGGGAVVDTRPSVPVKSPV